MSLSPIGSPVFELLKDKHTDRHHITLEYRYVLYNVYYIHIIIYYESGKSYSNLKNINNEVIAKWNCHNYYKQTVLLAQFTVKLLQQSNSATDLIMIYTLISCYNILIM